MHTVRCLNSRHPRDDVCCAGLPHREARDGRPPHTMNPTLPPLDRVPLDEGDVIADFRLLARLPRTHAQAAWTTWRAVDLMLGRHVALKLLRHEHADLEACAMIEDELRRGVFVPHPGLARRYGLRRDDTWVAVAEALIDEGDEIPAFALRAADADRTRRVVTLFAKAAEALAVAHGVGLVHGLLSPGNLLVTVDGLPKLSDVGLHRLVLPGLRVQRVLGSAHASPEQWIAARRGHWYASPDSDQFALAALLQHVLSGAHPYAGDDGLAHAGSALVRPRRRLGADPLDTVLDRALEADPRRRYADLAAFADDLRAVLDGHRVRARPPSVVGRLRRALTRASYRVLG